jgi:hypothetical protein
MTSVPIRDPLADHLLTPENAAFRRSRANPLGTKSHVRKPNPARDTRCQHKKEK